MVYRRMVLVCSSSSVCVCVCVHVCVGLGCPSVFQVKPVKSDIFETYPFDHTVIHFLLAFKGYQRFQCYKHTKQKMVILLQRQHLREH